MEVGVAITSLTSGFFTGILIGYAIKKVMKVLAIVAGLFLTALTYLQYQGIISVRWDAFEPVTESLGSMLITTENNMTGIISQNYFDSWGLSLTGGLASGFIIGFMKG
jgi:uncharacterized membrane protein (Fun14 family)